MTSRAVLGVALALALGACGRGDDRAAVRSVAERFYAAARSADRELACQQLSIETRKQLVADEQEGCARAIGSLELEGTTVDRVDVYGLSARVEFAHGDVVMLSDTREGWRIDAAGCRRQGPGPLDCEVEA